MKLVRVKARAHSTKVYRHSTGFAKVSEAKMGYATEEEIPRKGEPVEIEQEPRWRRFVRSIGRLFS